MTVDFTLTELRMLRGALLPDAETWQRLAQRGDDDDARECRRIADEHAELLRKLDAAH